MLSLDGADHARHREPFAHPFRPVRVQERFTGFIQAESDRLISAIQPAGGAELRREFAGPLAVAVVTEALGLDAYADTLLSWYAAIVGAVSDVTAGQPVTVHGADVFGRLRAAVTRAIGHRDKRSLLTAAVVPQHLEQLPVLDAVFPGVIVVCTHRDGVPVTLSMIAMLTYSARMHRAPARPKCDVGRNVRSRRARPARGLQPVSPALLA